MKKTIKCAINNRPVEVEEGTTIIQAFKKLEKEIAHYCWHPGLSTAGVCRLCMVEIEGRNKLEIACNTLVQEGMVITNQSQKVKENSPMGFGVPPHQPPFGLSHLRSGGGMRPARAVYEIWSLPACDV